MPLVGMSESSPRLAKSGHFLPTEKAILTDGFLFYANSPVWAYRPAEISRSGDLT
jgi:hypothetical protein